MTANLYSLPKSIPEETGSSSLCSGEGSGGETLAGARLWRGLDYGELRRRVGMREVLSLLQWQPVAARGPQLRGPCPLHPSSSPHSRSFSVHLEKGAFRCFGCGKQGNQLDLFAQTTGQPLYAAALELCRRLGVEPPFSPRAMSAPARSD